MHYFFKGNKVKVVNNYDTNEQVVIEVVTPYLSGCSIGENFITQRRNLAQLAETVFPLGSKVESVLPVKYRNHVGIVIGYEYSNNRVITRAVDNNVDRIVFSYNVTDLRLLDNEIPYMCLLPGVTYTVEGSKTFAIEHIDGSISLIDTNGNTKISRVPAKLPSWKAAIYGIQPG